MSFGSAYVTLPDFEYHRPQTLKEAFEILNEHGEEAKLMAGGVGLIAFMKERLMSPTHVVDIRGVPELGQVVYTSGRGLRIGATVTLKQVLADDTIRKKYPMIHETVSKIADPTVRGRATLVGNVCEAIPWVDSPTTLIALGSKVEIARATGARSVSLQDFIKGPVEVDLEPNEVVTAIDVPEFEGGVGVFEKFNAGSEFSIATLAATLVTEKGKKKARMVFGAVNSIPTRCLEAEKVIEEGGLTQATITRAADVASEAVQCVSDVLASADYRKHLIKVITINALERMKGK